MKFGLNKRELLKNEILVKVLICGIGLSFFLIKGLMLLQFIICLLMMVILVYKVSYHELNIKHLTSKWLLVLSFWFIWGFISYFWIQDVSLWAKDLQMLLLIVIYSVVITFVLKYNKKYFYKQLIRIFFITNIIHNLFGLHDLITQHYLFTFNPNMPQSFITKKIPLSTFYNPNDYAIYLLFSITLLFSIQLKNMHMKKKILLNILLISNIYILYMTESRINLFALLITTLLLFLFKIKSLKQIVFIMGLMISIPILLIGFKYLNNLISRDASGLTRLNLINYAIIHLKNSYLFGVGAGNLRYHLAYSNLHVTSHDLVHNWWIEILVNYGFIFFVYYTFFYVRSFIKSIIKSYHFPTPIKIFQMTWLTNFIIISPSSSSIFPFLWIWIINTIVFLTLDNE